MTESNTALDSADTPSENHLLRFKERFRPEPRDQKPKPRPESRPLHISRMLALAYKLREQIESGEVSSGAELAKRLKFSRARISQLLDLTLLAPKIQEEILFAEIESGYDPINEHALREILREKNWVRQEEMWRELCPEGL